MDPAWFITSIISSIVSLMAAMLNVFFIYCLWCLREESLQRTVKCLLTWCVGFSFAYQPTTLSLVYTRTFNASPVVSLVADIVHYFFACIALVSPSWLSVFYYFSIVPQELSILVWAKRNVSLVVFFSAVTDCLLILLSTVFMTVSEVRQLNEVVPGIMNLTNITSVEKGGTTPPPFSFSSVLYILHLQLSFWTLALTWGGTFIYLRRHMKAMAKNGSSFSQPTYRSQMRVTITGLIQAVFFLPCCLWVTTDAFIHGKVMLHYGLVTVCSVLGLINLVCLGLSQSVFRQQVLPVWNKLRCG